MLTSEKKLRPIINLRYDAKPLTWHLGTQVTDGSGVIELSLSTCTYIQEVIERFGLTEAYTSRCCVPMDSAKFKQNPLSKKDMPKTAEEKLDPERCPYRALLGCLSYISLWGRPDICTAISILARFQDNPGKRH